MSTVIMLGRIAPWKGQDVFLKAFANVFAGTDVRAKIVGGPLFGEHDFEDELEGLCKDLGLSKQVDFLGHIPDPWPLLYEADVLVHCSRIPEPFGRVVVQGMWAGCAVIATAPGGPEEIITDHVDGLLAKCDDVESLSAALTELRDDPDLAHSLARAGRERARAFSAEIAAPRLAEWLAQRQVSDATRRWGRFAARLMTPIRRASP